MPSDSSLVTFRIPHEDHELLKAVAHYSGESLSLFVRRAALFSARQILADVGPEAVLESVRTQEEQRYTESQRRRAEQLAHMRQAVDPQDPEH